MALKFTDEQRNHLVAEARVVYEALPHHKQQALKSEVQAIDMDGSGTIGYEELASYLHRRYETPSDEAQIVFGMVDADDSGFLDFWEACACILMIRGSAVHARAQEDSALQQAGGRKAEAMPFQKQTALGTGPLMAAPLRWTTGAVAAALLAVAALLLMWRIAPAGSSGQGQGQGANLWHALASLTSK